MGQRVLHFVSSIMGSPGNLLGRKPACSGLNSDLRGCIASSLFPGSMFLTQAQRHKTRHVCGRPSTVVSYAKEARDGYLLDTAASGYQKGLEAGLDDDDIVAQQLGAASADDLTDTHLEYLDKVKSKLAERAEQLKKEQEARAVKFQQGKLAYGRGQYTASVQFFERALDEEGPFSQFGGEIQLWLALAYQACGREDDCLDLYRSVEKTHPIPSIRKQAGELRFIMEAPKLEIKPEERVQIPVLLNAEKNSNDRIIINRARTTVRKVVEKSWEDEFLENYKPPVWIPNKYVLVATIVTATGLAVYSALLANAS